MSWNGCIPKSTTGGEFTGQPRMWTAMQLQRRQSGVRQTLSGVRKAKYSHPQLSPELSGYRVVNPLSRVEGTFLAAGRGGPADGPAQRIW